MTTMRHYIALVVSAMGDGLPQAILTEAMRPIDGLALHVSDLGSKTCVVLYDPATATPVGIGTVMELRTGLWIIGSVLCQHGYGPLLYAVVAEMVGERGGLLIPSELRSAAAKRMWKNFEKNPYVKVVPIPDQRTDQGVVFNHSPVGFGIVGNGSLDTAAAVRADDAAKAEMGGERFTKMLDAAQKQLRRAMERL